VAQTSLARRSRRGYDPTGHRSAGARVCGGFNAGDASGVARLFTEDGRVLPPNADAVQGRANIEAFFKEDQARPSLSLRLLTVHVCAGLCVAVGLSEVERHPKGASPDKDSGKFIEVWTRQSDGSWLLAEDIFNSNLRTPG
jgi:uncharacterized protein (TIGR02246 family)